LFEISEDEDEQEVLRRSPSNTYYLEKMRVFEETFGIDKLMIEVDKIKKQIQVSLLIFSFMLSHNYFCKNLELRLPSRKRQVPS
jgi:hypothetical protein